MPRMVVDGGTLVDDRIHVGDRDQDLDGAAGQALGDGELIEVPRVVVVDRAPEKIAQVAPPLRARARRPRDPVELLLDTRRELRLEPPLHHRAAGDLLKVGAVMHGLIDAHRVHFILGSNALSVIPSPSPSSVIPSAARDLLPLLR